MFTYFLCWYMYIAYFHSFIILFPFLLHQSLDFLPYCFWTCFQCIMFIHIAYDPCVAVVHVCNKFQFSYLYLSSLLLLRMIYFLTSYYLSFTLFLFLLWVTYIRETTWYLSFLSNLFHLTLWPRCPSISLWMAQAYLSL